jgi:type II secretory pathway pseudopilin PulG
LGIILVIAVPNIIGIIDGARRDSFLASARMMTSTARLRVSADPTLLPSGNLTAKGITLTDLNMSNMGKDPDGGTYGTNSYVYVVKDDTGVIRYFVTLQGSKRAIDNVEETNIATTTPGAADTATAIVTTGTVTLGGLSYTIQ